MIIYEGKDANATANIPGKLHDMESENERLRLEIYERRCAFLGELELSTLRRLAERKGVDVETIARGVVDGSIALEEFDDLLAEDVAPDSSKITAEGMMRLSDEYWDLREFAEKRNLKPEDPRAAVEYLLENPKEREESPGRRPITDREFLNLVDSVGDPELKRRVEAAIRGRENPGAENRKRMSAGDSEMLMRVKVMLEDGERIFADDPVAEFLRTAIENSDPGDREHFRDVLNRLLIY